MLVNKVQDTTVSQRSLSNLDHYYHPQFIILYHKTNHKSLPQSIVNSYYLHFGLDHTKDQIEESKRGRHIRNGY